MLKLSDALAAPLVQAYYRVGYSTEGESEWRGKLALDFGLIGAVKEEQFNRLAEGLDPWDGTVLIAHRPTKQEQDVPKWMTDDKAWSEYLWDLFRKSELQKMAPAAREIFEEAEAQRPENQIPPSIDPPLSQSKKHLGHIAAWDMNLAPAKSYSISALVGGDARLLEAHKQAVRIAIDSLETYTQARGGGAKMPINTENLCAAVFHHRLSRAVKDKLPDPQIHSHVVLMNISKAPDKLRSVNAYEWYRIQSYISSVYHSELAYRARELGYELEHGRANSTEIKGYSKDYLRAMSARTAEIEAEKARTGFTSAKSDELINKSLRRSKEDVDPATLKAEHKRQAQEYGNDPEAVVARARHRCEIIYTPVNNLPGHKEFISNVGERARLAHEAISFAKHRLFEQEAVVDHYELMRDALRYGLGSLRLQDVEQAFWQRRLSEINREFIPVQHYRSGAPGERFTTTEMQRLERESIAMALKGKGTTQPIAPKLTRDQFRDSYKCRTVNGEKIVLNDSQMWMAFNVLTASDQVMIVRGLAGAGKTTAMQPIAEIAEQHRSRGYDVLGLAATGAASNNLGEAGIRSDTLQKHLLHPVSESARKRLFVVDEGSLVGTRQFHAFLKGLRAEDRVVIVYDPRQHQSVEAGRIVEELEQAGVTVFRLETIVRQRNAPELLEAVKLFAQGKTIAGLELMDSQDRIKEIADRAKRFEYMALHFARDPDHTVICAPDNRSIGEFNQAVRKQLQQQGMLGPDRYEATILEPRRDIRHVDRMRAVTYHEGNIVRFTRSVKVLHIKCGEYGRVMATDIERNQVTMELRGRTITYNPGRAFGVEIFTPERRSFAQGERVQFTRPWRYAASKKVANREMGVLEKLDEHGKATLRLENGRSVQFNLREMPHLDYGYASTSYSLQSRTAQNVLVHLDVGDPAIRQLLDKALVYVSASRGDRNVLVFCDNRAALLSDHSPVNRVSEKPKALAYEEVQGHAMKIGAVA